MVKSRVGTKLYYSISEVAEITDLQPYTLRAWEKEFPCLRPRRARGKNRAYRERDIGIVQLIKQLLYEEGYTTKGVKQKLKNEPGLLRSTTFTPPQSDPKPVKEQTNNNILASVPDEKPQVHSPVTETISEKVPDQTESLDELEEIVPDKKPKMHGTIRLIKKELQEILELL
jgi:DNA-binding transcriptional MerR regulator